MRNEIRGALASLALIAAPALAPAHDGGHEGHDHAPPSHGGVLGKSDRYAFEVVTTAEGVRVFPYQQAEGGKFQPLAASKLSGTVLVSSPAIKPVPLPLKPAVEAEGRPAASLFAKADLAKFPAKGASVTVKVSGLSPSGGEEAEITVPFKLVAITMAPATKEDAKAIAAQKVCAASGEDLGSMGTPLKVTRGGQSTFICCKGCVRKIQQDPDKYFSAAKK